MCETLAISDVVRCSKVRFCAAMRSNARRSLGPALAALAVACPAAIRAQTTLGGGDTPSSNACIEHLPRSAFTRVAVYVTADVPDSMSRNFAATADELLQELAITAQ